MKNETSAPQPERWEYQYSEADLAFILGQLSLELPPYQLSLYSPTDWKIGESDE